MGDSFYQRLSEKTIEWRVLVVLFAVMIGVFVWQYNRLTTTANTAEKNEEVLRARLVDLQSEMRTLKADIAQTKTSTNIEAVARENGFIAEGEVCFEIENPEALKNYTPEEWQTILDEMLY